MRLLRRNLVAAVLLSLALPAWANSPHAGVYIGNMTDVPGTTQVGWFAFMVRTNGTANAIFFDFRQPADGGTVDDIVVKPDGSFAFDLAHPFSSATQPGRTVSGTFAAGTITGNVCDYTFDSFDPGCPGSVGNNPQIGMFFAIRSPARGLFAPFGGLFTGTMTGAGSTNQIPVSAAGPLVMIADAAGQAVILASPRPTLGSTPLDDIDASALVQFDPSNPVLNYTLTGGGASQISGTVNYLLNPPSGDGVWTISGQTTLSGTWDISRVESLPDALPHLVSMADVNGDNTTDLGVALRKQKNQKITLHVIDGSNGNSIRTVGFGNEPARGFTCVADANGDTVPEFGGLVDGSLFARVKDIVNNTQLGKPKFNASYDPFAFLSVGDAGGSAGPDVAVVGRHPTTGKVQAWVKEAASGAPITSINFGKAFSPVGAVAVDNVGDSSAMEIAFLGINANGKVQATVYDAKSGNLVGKVNFSKKFLPLLFAAVPDANGELTNLAVLGRNASGVVLAQIKRVSDNTTVSNVKFSKFYFPEALFSFADSNGSGGGEIGVVGVNIKGKVRAQVFEIADGTRVSTINFSSKFPPLSAIAVNGVAGTGQNEIAVLGENSKGKRRIQVMDLLSGNQVTTISVP